MTGGRRWDGCLEEAKYRLQPAQLTSQARRDEAQTAHCNQRKVLSLATCISGFMFVPSCSACRGVRRASQVPGTTHGPHCYRHTDANR